MLYYYMLHNFVYKQSFIFTILILLYSINWTNFLHIYSCENIFGLS